GLGLGAGSLRLDAGRLRLRGRLLGLPAGDPRRPLRPGRLLPAAVAHARLVLPAELRRRRRYAVLLGPVRAAVGRAVLLRRLLRPGLRPRRLSRVGPVRLAASRPAVRLLPLVAPRRP